MNLKKHSQTLSSWTGRLVACLLPLLLTLTASAGEQLYFYHTDHLGTPQVMTDDQGQVVWEGHYRPFGEVELTVEGVGSNLRFPGQYFDGETGSYYNYFRDYDPTTGRYVQSDPIGLAGGLNTYAYVLGNPIKYKDPSGLILWEGEMHARGVVAGVGGGWTEFTLTSECINGRQATIEVLATGPGAGVGFAVSETYSDISFEDYLDNIKPSIFSGGYGAVSVGIVIGPYDLQYGKIRLGGAFSRESFELRGLDLGATAYFGSSTVTDEKWSDCVCAN